MRLWDPVTRTPVGQPLTGQSELVAVAFSPDRTLLATISHDENGLDDDGTVQLWAVPADAG
ncbi:hypothetical protein [Streptomyces sp. NPDC058291]|uniref:hypothetical protein n=1 Tax=Streptomyces sp. NPDC058291 TaxID=3346427 RepID=UPI0036EF0E3F